MSKESLDYQKLCSNYYSSLEEGCCMESCEFYNHNECPVVYVNGLLEERDKTISDLEAKLAEKEVDILALDTDNYSFKQQIDSLKQQLADTEAQNKRVLEKLELIVSANQELEQQLAEKDEEIKDRINQVRTLYFQLYELQKAVEYCQKHHKKNKLTPLTLHNYTNEQHNQDKISFCIEKLEKVKEFVKETSGIVGHEWRIDRFRVLDTIDNQIASLKKGVE